MKKIFYLLALMLITTISGVANAQIRRSSYQISETKLVKWTGDETEIDLSSDEKLSEVTEISIKAFFANRRIRNIILPKNLKIIDFGAFAGCANLQGIIIPEGVTTIADAAFHSCQSLKTIDIPSTVSVLGDGAFFLNNITKLDKVICRSTTPPARLHDSFLKFTNRTSSLTLDNIDLYVPKSALQTYTTLNNNAPVRFRSVNAIDNNDPAPNPTPEKTISLNFSVSPANSATFEIAYNNDTYEGESLNIPASVKKSITIKSKAMAGYKFVKYTLNNLDFDSNNMEEFTLDLSDYEDLQQINIVAVYVKEAPKEEKINVVFEVEEGGTIAHKQANSTQSEFKKSYSQMFNISESITIIAKSEQGYKFDKFIINGLDMDLRGATSIELPLQGYKGLSEIKIVAVFSKKTSIDGIDADTKVFTSDGNVVILSDTLANVKIYSIDGNKVFDSNVANASIKLDKGLYIVSRLSKTYKVLVQ